MLDKLKIQNGNEKVFEWCKINYLKFTSDLDLDSNSLKSITSKSNPLKSNSITKTSNSSCYKRKNNLSNGKRGCHGDDEIDDIFNNI